MDDYYLNTLTVRFVADVIFLSKCICQHRIVSRLESQGRKLTRILKQAPGGGAGGRQHLGGFLLG